MASEITYEPSFSSPSPSPSSSQRRWSYDVFLSFRGEDTRTSFAAHLYDAMIDAGINAFMDDNELRRGKDISTELLKAIQESRISLIVFSRNYAASRWCLEELVKIIECKNTVQQVVLPIFYDVDPSDVRKQTGIFGEAFAELKERFAAEMDKVLRWKAALTEAANLSGWDLTSPEYGYEAKTIKRIVEEILKHVNDTYLNVALYPVGIDSRVGHMNSLLSVGLDDVRIIGICAMGGMGKTTIAKAVYNQFFLTFESKSFLSNVREIAKDPNGLVHLQEQLLFDILKNKRIKVSSIDRGINLIKKRLCNKRVLVVLDDIDQLEQLNAIARKRDWFGLGSRIIITTRDEHLLKEIEVDETYMLEEMQDDESLELFSWHAFRKSHPKQDYAELSQDVIGYCKGLPLALEVLGSFLFGRSIREWKSALAKLKKIPHDQIQEKLRVSFDALDEDEKNIFLDIACFFIAVDRDYVAKILDGCDFFAEIGISVLVERCLLKIMEDNKLMIHDLLRDMGREFVREKYPKEPGKWSRLWINEDVIDVLNKNRGTEKIEGMILNLPSSNEVHLSTKAFANMHKLRLLQLNYVHLRGDDYGDLSKELRWLCWHGFPLKFIPKSLYVEDLVAIDMRYSNLKQVWNETKFLGKLKVLDLSHSYYLTKTPNFSQLPNLEKLILQDCIRLVEVHPSIGCLDQLVLVNIRDCKHLRNLPMTISKLKSLKILDLSGCSELVELPEDLGEMKELIVLHVDGTAIGRRVPSTNRRNLSLFGCMGLPSNSWASFLWSWVKTLPPTSIFSFLTELSLDDRNLADEALPRDLDHLSSLKYLDLRSNDFCNLPASITDLPRLIRLELDHCKSLQSLPELPTSLKILYAQGCTSLDSLPNLSRFKNIPWLFLANCDKLIEIPGLEKSQFFRNIRLEGCNNLTSTFKESLLQFCQPGRGTIVLPGNEIPHWFTYQSTSPSLSVQTPRTWEVKGMNFCIVYATDYNDIKSNFNVTVTNKTKKICRDYSLWMADFVVSPQDHLLACSMSCADMWEGGDEVEVSVPLADGLYVKKCGLNLMHVEQAQSSQCVGAAEGEITCSDIGNDHKSPKSWSYETIFIGHNFLHVRGSNVFKRSSGSLEEWDSQVEVRLPTPPFMVPQMSKFPNAGVSSSPCDVHDSGRVVFL